MNEEDKTSIERLANMNLEGLLLPEPAPASYWWLWVIIGLLIVVTMWLWLRKFRSPKATALRELKQLHKDLKAKRADVKNIKEQIALSLRQGFEVTRLDNAMPDNMKWREYLKSLEVALYANQSSDPQSLSLLITNAQTWLKKHVRNS